MNKYYVYMHRRATDGSIFYVGKGHGKRAYYKHNRSLHWRNIESKSGFEVDICQSGMSEPEAFLLEMWVIASLRHKGVALCNLTDGGEGMSNPSEETRRKLSEAHLGKKMTEDQRKAVSDRMRGELNYWYGKTFSDEHKEKLAAARIDRKLTETHRKRIGDSNLKREEVTLYNDKLSAVYIGCRSHMGSLGLCRTLISGICSGKRKIAKGWVLQNG